MNDDLMRLSDLVPEYARCYRVSTQEAAHALHELIEELYVEHGVNRWRPNSINNIFWVGGAGDPKRTSRSYVLYFQLLSKYFYNIFESPLEIEKSLVNCYCEDDQQSKNIPASVIFFSKPAFGEWIFDAGIEVPSFLVDGITCREAVGDDERKAFQTKELNSISLIINGLIRLINEVDRAHAEQTLDDTARRRASAIRHRASKLRSSRKSFDIGLAILSLADAAEVDMPKSQKTLRKYMGDCLSCGEDESQE
ncbi:hypothetical protein HBO34_04465 [Pseudomonas veronii]|uniref:hypothetical protein n=1 Tax=Pseudomonas veronii TaxID=76761 RepID=UPI001474771F|nr:hypothetical protein [Pseudomonas veronii]NMX37132.1 hypothetical protein [Pseudomonas veronii]